MVRKFKKILDDNNNLFLIDLNSINCVQEVGVNKLELSLDGGNSVLIDIETKRFIRESSVGISHISEMEVSYTVEFNHGWNLTK